MMPRRDGSRRYDSDSSDGSWTMKPGAPSASLVYTQVRGPSCDCDRNDSETPLKSTSEASLQTVQSLNESMKEHECAHAGANACAVSCQQNDARDRGGLKPQSHGAMISTNIGEHI